MILKISYQTNNNSIFVESWIHYKDKYQPYLLDSSQMLAPVGTKSQKEIIITKYKEILSMRSKELSNRLNISEEDFIKLVNGK